MKLLTSALAFATASVLLTGTAFAADMPIKGPRYVNPTYNWTGFYAGLNAGYAWVDGSGTITMGGASGPVSGSGSGFFGGAQIGYNHQIRSIVLGVEADIQASAQKGSFNGSAGANTFTSDATVPWFTTFRGRVGYAFDRIMPYLTAGGVYGNSKIEGTSSVTGPFSESRSFFTYTFGGGVEAAIVGRWTAKAEYLYVGTPNHIPVPPGTTNVDGTITTHLVRAGLNYRF